MDYKFLFLKKDFFIQQQEYRFALYNTKISEPQNFSVLPIEDGEIYSLDEFFAGVEVSIPSIFTHSTPMTLGF